MQDQKERVWPRETYPNKVNLENQKEQIAENDDNEA